ncbi:MAG: TlyA family RNA methyltransferase [Clostridia bacterium]
MTKKRLDVHLVELGLCQSREAAKNLIKEGKVFVNNEPRDKASYTLSEGDEIRIVGDTLKYVSRGGLKIEKAIKAFNILLKDKVCMDIGASTGGFTDCMLQNGAKKVFAVDVGSGQLAEKLREDERVVNMEKTNIRSVTKKDIGEDIDFISIDVAFISLKLVLPVAYNLLNDGGELMALIKPQFEAGRGNVGKKGVVKDKNIHESVIKNVILFAEEMGFSVVGVDFSPVRGPEGNIEYLMYLKKVHGGKMDMSNIKDIVKRSHLDAE